jgi:hypothetical protein
MSWTFNLHIMAIWLLPYIQYVAIGSTYVIVDVHFFMFLTLSTRILYITIHKHGLRTEYVGTSLILYLHFFTAVTCLNPPKFSMNCYSLY